MKRSSSLVGLILLAFMLPAQSAAAEDLPDALDVVGRINARDEGLTSTRNIKMELIDRGGGVRTRETVFFRRYVPGLEAGDAGEKWIALFYLSPTTIKDTGFLSHDYLESKRDDEQWLYLPAVRRSRRIALRDRGKSFLGTDLSYDDVRNETKVTATDYQWTTLRREQVDGHATVVLQAIPIDKQTARYLGYSKVEFKVDPEIWMVRAADYWDVANRHLKTSRQLDIRAVDGIWTPHRVEVVNHRTFHRTHFTYSEIRYGQDLPDDLFTERALRRGPPAL